MAIELPEAVVQFLNFIGVPWINVNEDKVRALAAHVREFGSSIDAAHSDATDTLTALGSGYQGSAYEALMNMWTSKSTLHVNELIETCSVLATALEAGADFIEAEKVACIAELVAMAAAFVADQAAAVFTAGLSEAALPLIEEGAEKLMEFAEQQLEQYIIGEIMSAALKPLIAKIDSLVQALVITRSESAPVGAGYAVDLDHLSSHAQVMSSHAATVSAHVDMLTTRARALDFST